MPATLYARWKRAKQDTEFSIGEELIGAIATAIGAWFIRRHFNEPGELVSDLWFIVLAAIVGAVVVPILKFIWNFIKAPHRILEEENAVLVQSNKEAESHIKALTAESHAGAKQWREMAERFAKEDKFIGAQWNRTSAGSELWHFSGGNTHNIEALCRIAGTMLIKSQRVARELPSSVTTQTNPMYRWLLFIKDSNFRGIGNAMYGIEVGEDGNPTGGIHFNDVVNNLSELSSRACIYCESLET
jgi:hypothetical protein